MTAEEYKNLKVGDVIHFKNGTVDKVFEIIETAHYHKTKYLKVTQGKGKEGDNSQWCANIEDGTLLPLYSSPLYLAMNEEE